MKRVKPVTGYVLKDKDGRMYLGTVRSSRVYCWRGGMVGDADMMRRAGWTVVKVKIVEVRKP